MNHSPALAGFNWTFSHTAVRRFFCAQNPNLLVRSR